MSVIFFKDLAFGIPRIKRFVNFVTSLQVFRLLIQRTGMKNVASLLFFVWMGLFFAFFAFAQAPQATIIPVGGVQASALGIQGITSTSTLVDAIIGLVNWVAWFVGLLAVLMTLVAAMLFITGGGNPETLAKARNSVMYIIIGVSVSVLAFGIVAISKAFLSI